MMSAAEASLTARCARITESPGVDANGIFASANRNEDMRTVDLPDSSVTITERGSVYNPIFRFMSRFIFGHTATVEAYLDAPANDGLAQGQRSR